MLATVGCVGWINNGKWDIENVQNNLLLQWTQQGLKNVQEKSKKSPVEQIAMAIFFTKICNNKKLWKMYLLERLNFLYV